VEQFDAQNSCNEGRIVSLLKYQTLIRSSKNRGLTIYTSIINLGSKSRRVVVFTLRCCNLIILNI
jgi:hypothetical protein